jgi:hypothetical protein
MVPPSCEGCRPYDEREALGGTGTHADIVDGREGLCPSGAAASTATTVSPLTRSPEPPWTKGVAITTPALVRAASAVLLRKLIAATVNRASKSGADVTAGASKTRYATRIPASAPAG